MAARKAKAKTRSCSECGVVLRDGAHSCPLCGTSTGEDQDVDAYQSDLRRLREQLQELRHEGREAS